MDIAEVIASNGQFIKRVDVENYVSAADTQAAGASEGYEVMPMTRIRQIIGKRMRGRGGAHL